jgi:hypothetical protein
MKRYIPKKGDRVVADRKSGTFIVLKVNMERAVADLQLFGKVAGKRYVTRDIPFAHIRPLKDDEDFSQAAARIVRRATDKAQVPLGKVPIGWTAAGKTILR